jgi:hypothetical protein
MAGRISSIFLPRSKSQRLAVRYGLFFLLSLSLGCRAANLPEAEVPPSQPEQAASRFDPRTAGTIQGCVTWQGDLPTVAPYQARINLSADGVTHERLVRENPNAPHIDGGTRGVGGAVVFLRGVDPQAARPWDHPPVRIEQQGYRFHVRQGDLDTHVGVVRRGDRIEMVSRESAFHALHAGGATFFTLAFPDPDQPLSRCLPNKGLVELTSAAGYYWMRAYLFVDDHPYYTRTDAQGRFVLPQVPPGCYEIVCWLPHWREERHERDPETGLVTRLFFARPVEVVRSVTLGSRETAEVRFQLSMQQFLQNP